VVESILNIKGCKYLQAISQIVKFTKNEEITANYLMIVKLNLKDVSNFEIVLKEYSDILNEIIESKY
jgi:hypothetical protein